MSQQSPTHSVRGVQRHSGRPPEPIIHLPLELPEHCAEPQHPSSVLQSGMVHSSPSQPFLQTHEQVLGSTIP